MNFPGHASFTKLYAHTFRIIPWSLQEIEDLKEQIKNQGTSVEVDGMAPDITELLRQIREQYEQMVLKNRDETESWYKAKVQRLSFRHSCEFTVIAECKCF